MFTRLILLRRGLLFGLSVLVLRLADVQLIHGGMYRRLAEQNRLRLVPQSAPRGLILDRRGRRIATNSSAFQVTAVPQELKDRATVFARLAPLLHVSPKDLEQRFLQSRNLPFLPATIAPAIAKPVAFRVEEEGMILPGIAVEPVITRHYPYGSVAAHILGYLSQPSEDAFPVLKQYGIRPHDLVGRAGVERELDAYLRGTPGGSLIEVDHRARQVRVLGHREPVPGQSVVLTIDIELSALIAQAFGEQPGAAVVLEPKTGEVLAMVSVPSFDPEAFATQNMEAIQDYMDDEERTPMRDRATTGQYAPGSTAKLITGLTALEQGIINPQTTVVCPGYLEIGNRKFHCWNRDGHGPMKLSDALRQSCNVYFMEIGRRVGLERLRAGFSAVGFGRRTGWALGEQPGRLPTGRRFSEGEVAIFAIGQGEFLVSPLQSALMVSAVANQGWLVEPWLVQSIGEQQLSKTSGVSLGWNKANITAIREGMLAVVNSPDGTGMRAHSDRVVIAGKTGTAQTHLSGRTHAWFVGFCPADHPQAAFSIVAEYGGTGGELPARIGRAICEYLVAEPARDSSP